MSLPSGRVTTTHTLGAQERGGDAGAAYRTRDATLAPEEVLFARAAAPQRFAERDSYFAHERLPPGAELPASDMLKEVHRYAGRFYEALGRAGGDGLRGMGGGAAGGGDAGLAHIGDRHVDELSMDETALLAFGILLEEAGREVLGRDGDLVFTQAEDEDDDDVLPGGTGGARGRPASRSGGSAGGFDSGWAWRRKNRKRVKLGQPEDSDAEA